MQQITRIDTCRQWSRRQQADGKTIGFVPTMGALHRGHLALVNAAKKACDKVIVSIFVNPLQFNNENDYTKYPITLDNDLKQLATCNIDAVFMPDRNAFYPTDFKTEMRLPYFNKVLCGKYRPFHLDGVSTVITKFFNIILPDQAFFGEKDYQQLLLIKHLVKDLALPTQVIGVETVRDVNNVALSSRNMRLSKRDYIIAENLPMVLESIQSADDLTVARQTLLDAGFSKIDYLEIRDSETLRSTIENTARVFVAAFVGSVRLIDNMAIG